MLPRRQPISLVAALAAVVALVTGCGSADDWSRSRPAPGPVGVLGSGFVDPSTAPAPESTITPRPGSWDEVRPSKSYRVVLLTAGDDPQTATVVAAVTTWAKAEGIRLKTFTATEPDEFVPIIANAIDLRPDLVIGAGHDLIDPLALVTPSHLDQRFLVVGAELAEPTGNVTAADWEGASFRGEGLGMSSTYDPASFTPERALRAVRAGVAAVLHGLTGIVIWVD